MPNGERAGAACAFDLTTPGGEPVARVVSIEPDVVPRGARRQAEVGVAIGDALGAPVPGAQVVLRVFGDINQVVAGLTDADGRVVVRTRRAARPPVNHSVCVLSVVAELPYERTENAETCDSR